MSFRVPVLVTAGLLGLGLSVGTVQKAVSSVEPATVGAASSIYSQALRAATSLRGAPASDAAGQSVSLEFVTSLLRAVSFDAGQQAPAGWTLFLPIDSAFSVLDGEQLDAIVHSDAALKALLDAHIAGQSLSIADLERGAQALTLDGEPLVLADQGGLRVNGAGILADLRVGNGHVFIVDRLL
jgi:uncharacterized surface protein with fasciclin (FAS1) repeats